MWSSFIALEVLLTYFCGDKEIAHSTRISLKETSDSHGMIELRNRSRQWKKCYARSSITGLLLQKNLILVIKWNKISDGNFALVIVKKEIVTLFND